MRANSLNATSTNQISKAHNGVSPLSAGNSGLPSDENLMLEFSSILDRIAASVRVQNSNSIMNAFNASTGSSVIATAKPIPSNNHKEASLSPNKKDLGKQTNSSDRAEVESNNADAHVDDEPKELRNAGSDQEDVRDVRSEKSEQTPGAQHENATVENIATAAREIAAAKSTTDAQQSQALKQVADKSEEQVAGEQTPVAGNQAVTTQAAQSSEKEVSSEQPRVQQNKQENHQGQTSEQQAQGDQNEVPLAQAQQAQGIQAETAAPSESESKIASPMSASKEAAKVASEALLTNAAAVASELRAQFESLVRQAVSMTTGESSIAKDISVQKIGESRGLSFSAPQNTTGADGQAGKTTNAAARNDEARSLRNMPKLNPQRTMEKVESALKEAAKAKDGKTISIRLDPPSLGAVKIDVSLRDGHLHARVVAESPEVNLLLREKAADIQQTLRKLGLAVDTVSVAVGQDQDGSSSQSGGKNSTSNGQTQKEQNAPQLVSDGLALGLAPGSPTTSSTDVDHWVA